MLASRALDLIPPETQVDWVVGKPSAFLLKNDSRIAKLWVFPSNDAVASRRSAWKELLRELASQDYDLVIDLHSVWRTWYARFYFFFYSKKRPVWKTLKKERFRRLFYILFKKISSSQGRPHLYRDRVERFIYRYLPGARLPRLEKRERRIQPRIAIAPGSAWPGKQWPLAHWIELITRAPEWARGKTLLVVGRSNEPIVNELLSWAKRTGVPIEALIDCQDREQLADTIRTCEYLICNDSFIAHFSEKVGVPVTMLFGPTRKDFGFGPFLDDSQSVESPVGCSPCGKDGSNCYFFGEKRFFCQKQLTPSLVIESLRERKSRIGLVT